MSFDDLLNALQNVECQEKRGADADSVELVVTPANLAAIRNELDGYFGEPLKPEGKLPNLTAVLRSKPYGGIRQNQTMYYKKDETSVYVALFWPWGSGELVTVKVFRE